MSELHRVTGNDAVADLNRLLPVGDEDEDYGDWWVAAWFALPEERRPAPGLDVWWAGR